MGKLVALWVVLAALAFGMAQNVGGLRQSSWDLPVTAADNTVVSEFFGAISAVQTVCSESLRASLAAERALAACARLGDYFDAELGRSMTELKLRSLGAWTTPWQENADFGTVRQLSSGGATYFLAIDAAAGLAYVIRFQ